mgnify:CR=1 FL=1
MRLVRGCQMAHIPVDQVPLLQFIERQERLLENGTNALLLRAGCTGEDGRAEGARRSREGGGGGGVAGDWWWCAE